MGTNSLFQNRWWIPCAGCLGIMVGIASVLVLPFAVFLKPVTDDLGWTRGQMSAALAISSVELSRQRGWGVDGIHPLPVGTPTNAFAAMATGQIDGDVTGVGSAYTAQEAGKARAVMDDVPPADKLYSSQFIPVKN